MMVRQKSQDITWLIQSIIFPFLFILLGCQNSQNNHETHTKTAEKSRSHQQDSIKTKNGVDYLLADQLLFNGKHKRYFSRSEFETVYGNPDSTELLSVVQPCNIIFENESGGIDQNNSYLYKNGSTFQSVNDKVAVEEFRFVNGNFITYQGFKIDAKTTVGDLRKLFPEAVQNISSDQHFDEVDLKSITLEEDKNGISDGHIRIFFKGNQVYSIWWWWPC